MNSNYETSDFYLTAFLIARGMKLLSHRKQAGGRTVFIFEECPERVQLQEEYFAEGMVRAADYKHAIRDLKGMIHA